MHVETLRSGWLTTGPKVRQFEEAFAGHVGRRHAVAVNPDTSFKAKAAAGGSP
jgi:dTDP-4-amino-4,6-dideoxygalactose transaminase